VAGESHRKRKLTEKVQTVNFAQAETCPGHLARHKIILQRMPAEMLLGICQIFMSDSGEHGMFQFFQSAIRLVAAVF
jgi:hypothetical protein